MAEDDDFFDKALEGFAMFALNQGEVCTCPSRALVQESDLRRVHGAGGRSASRRSSRATRSTRHDDRRAGLATSSSRRSCPTSTSAARRAPRCLIGGERAELGGELAERLLHPADGVQGPQQDADLPGGDLRPGGVGHDLQGRGRGAGDRQRHALRPRRRRLDPRRQHAPTASAAAIQAGRVWTNCYHAYPAHAAFGGYKQSGIGRENHKMMLDHYQQTKNLLVSYSPKKLGFF